MSDPNVPRDPHDPRDPRRDTGVRDRDSNPYTRYIIAGAAVIVLILAVIIFTGTGDDVGVATDPGTDPAIEEPGATGATPPDADAPGDPDTAPAMPEQQEQPETQGN